MHKLLLSRAFVILASVSLYLFRQVAQRFSSLSYRLRFLLWHKIKLRHKTKLCHKIK